MGEVQSKQRIDFSSQFISISKDVARERVVQTRGNFVIINKAVSKDVASKYKQELSIVHKKMNPEFKGENGTMRKLEQKMIFDIPNKEEGDKMESSEVFFSPETDLKQEINIEINDPIHKLYQLRTVLMKNVKAIFQTIQYETENIHSSDEFSISMSNILTEDKRRIYRTYTQFNLETNSSAFLSVMNDIQFQRSTDNKIEKYTIEHKFNDDFWIYNLVYKKVERISNIDATHFSERFCIFENTSTRDKHNLYSNKEYSLFHISRRCNKG